MGMNSERSGHMGEVLGIDVTSHQHHALESKEEMPAFSQKESHKVSPRAAQGSAHNVSAVSYKSPADATSSLGTWTNTGFSSSSVRPCSTKATSITTAERSMRSFKKATPAGDCIAEEADVPLVLETAFDGLPTQIVGDGESTISADSVELSAVQKEEVIAQFSTALLKHISTKGTLSSATQTSSAKFREQFQNLLKSYSETVKNTNERTKRRASKAIRALRRDISRRCEEALCGTGSSLKDSRIYPNLIKEAAKVNLPERTLLEKVDDWICDLNPEMLLPYQDGVTGPQMIEPAAGRKISQSIISSAPLGNMLPAEAASISGADVDDSSDSQSMFGGAHLLKMESRDIYSYFTTHPAFSDLINGLQKLVERHYCNQMDLIHHRVLLRLRRPVSSIHHTSTDCQAIFQVDWDVLSFLRSQYDTGIAQDLGMVITITGQTVNAQLSTVYSYLEQTWSVHTLTLLRAIQFAIRQSEEPSSAGIYPSATAMFA
jgi:hypothetical protein